MDPNSLLLWQFPPIVRNIFKFLSAKDLRKCAQVCKVWRSISITETKRRRFVEFFLEFGIGQKVDMDGKTVPDIPPSGCMYPFQEQLASIHTQPHFCLAFITEQTLENFEDIFPCLMPIRSPRKKIKRLDQNEIFNSRLKSVGDHLLKPLLNQCQLHSIAVPGIIGCHDNRSAPEVASGHSILGILLPDFPGVTVHHCRLDDPFQLENKTLPTPPIKCLLMFAGFGGLNIIQDFINNTYAFNGSVEFAIGGVIVKPVFSSQTGGVGSCFAFAGENLEAASVVIDKSTTDIEYELALFKKTGLLKNQCFALVFSWGLKGMRKCSDRNNESNVFRSMYPGVPLTGVLGTCWEVGLHFLPNMDEEDSDHKERCKKFHREKCVRFYGSIFVLLSVKTPK